MIYFALVVVLTAALYMTKYQSQMFDISPTHFRFVELLQKSKLAVMTMIFFISVAFVYAFFNLFQGVIYA